MRDIVATIQPEQDLLVRADLDDTICVQGAPGTGKTAVGLHRAAYLLYAHRERLQRAGVLVIGPNASFLRYIGDVLPALGEVDARQTTIEDLLATVEVRAVDPPAVGVLKGDARMAEVLHRAVWSYVVGTDRADGAAPRLAPLAGRPDRPRRSGDRAPSTQRPVRRRAGDAVAADLAPRAGPDGGGRRVTRRPGAGRGGPQPPGPGLGGRALARARPGEGGVPAARRPGLAEPRSRPGSSIPRSSAARVGSDPARAGPGTVDGRRRRAGRRGDRPAPSHRQRGPCRARRGAGPLADAAARGRAPLLDRLGDAAGRPRPGHHAVVGHLVGGVAGASGQGRCRRSRSSPSASASRPTSSRTRPGCCPTVAPGLAPPTSIRTAVGGLVVRPVPEVVDAGGRRGTQPHLPLPGRSGWSSRTRWSATPAAHSTPAGLAYTMLGAEEDVDARLDLVPATLAKGLEFDHVIVVEPARHRPRRSRRTDRPAPALRVPDPRCLDAHRRPHQAAPCAAGLIVIGRRRNLT